MPSKKDIVFLCQFFHPEYISSAQLPYDTARALQKVGFSVDVVCGYPKEYYSGDPVPRQEALDGIHVRRLRYLQPDRGSKLGRLVNYFSFTLSAFLNLPRLRHYRALVVYSNPPILPWVAALAKKLYGCKLVFVSYDLYPELALRTGALKDGSLICRVMDRINRSVFTKADRVVALSSEMKDFIAGNRPTASGNIAVIPNWYPDKGENRRDLTGNRFADTLKDKFVVSYFGNMGTIQDMDTILGAIRCLREDDSVFFLFAGHGNKLQLLQQEITRENLKNAQVLEYLHGKDYQDALDISSAALISLQPGTTGLCVPSKTYSYMMEGIPLIAIMENSDIVRDIQKGAGIQAQNGRPEALAAQIKAMQKDPAAHAQMRRVCRNLYLHNYTPEVCTRKYADLFRDLLEERA